MLNFSNDRTYILRKFNSSLDKISNYIKNTIMHHAHHHHNHYLVALSVLIAVFASYTALDLVQSVTNSKGKIKSVWLFGSSLAMGIGIWSMHFIGMLAFSIPGTDIYYNVPLLVLSILVAVLASALALYIVACLKPTTKN
jgi:NO-binding membrane sensor protein with MHYT domain